MATSEQVKDREKTDLGYLSGEKYIEGMAEVVPNMLADYLRLHAAPELSHHEKNTAWYIADRLRKMGYEVAYPFGEFATGSWTCHGVVALWTQGKGPCVLYRADMDALPIEEKTGLPYASRVRMRDDDGREVPVMHACGHDLHCALLLGLAEMMIKCKQHWRGTVMFVAQPAEESSDGAEALLRAGLYEKFARPDYALAVHAHDSTPAGEMRLLAGYAFAGVNGIDLTVRGVGGHGAYPEKCIDPIVLAAQIILALQTVISRAKSALDPAVITVGAIHGGNRRNIIPEQVVLEMTVRTYKPSVRENILSAIERIARGTAIAAGVPPERWPLIHRLTAIPPVYHSPQLVQRCRRVLKKTLGADKVSEGEPTLGAEDFAGYALGGRIPSAILWLGVADPKAVAAASASGTVLPPIHSPYFSVATEPALRTGLKAMTAILLDLLS